MNGCGEEKLVQSFHCAVTKPKEKAVESKRLKKYACQEEQVMKNCGTSQIKMSGRKWSLKKKKKDQEILE